ncbi:heat-inducible transcriptional repressor HrcA [Clostridium polynesiense]|uniref:heat-inducible transcriptional repressor HrcA n=1 Tax=Clostridium polynesiense TaxID=1325933 RepID=UPI00058FE0A4|nr:heat-inducible transcriptional repressor HrcA [Clostridium polynesiense]
MEIDDRKIKILHAIINDYIFTGEPVGSRTIAKKYDLGVSSATIRNEMADLEDMGYIEQLHTSSGRKPSDKGYRLYVDKLMKIKQLPKEEEIMIKEYLINAALFEVDKIVKQASALLSELTKLTCIVKSPSVKKSCVKALQLLGIDKNSVLMVLVTDSGLIKNNIIKVEKVPSASQLLVLSNVLNDKLKDLSVEEINLAVISNLKKYAQGYDELFNSILSALYETLIHSDIADIHMEGTTNIFNYPEYNDISKAREFLSLIYNKDTMTSLLNVRDDISIKIGEENFIKEAKDCSFISAVYRLGDRPLGTIGLIGPTRIDYSRVTSIMLEVITELNMLLKNGLED